MPRLLLLLVTLLFISCEQEWTSVAPRHKKYFATMPEPEKPRRWLDFEYDKATVHVAVDNFGKGFNALFESTLPARTITRELSKWEIYRLDEMLSSNDDDSIPRPKCFMPRHGIVFWDKKGESVASVEVCFECGTTRIFPETRHYNYKNDYRFFESLGLPGFHSHNEHKAYYEKLYKKLHPEED